MKFRLHLRFAKMGPRLEFARVPTYRRGLFDGASAREFLKEAAMAATKITPSHNGPLRVEGDFEIVDPGGQPFGLAGRTKISLCRCGHSANKPFCDGTHKVVGFTDEVHARDLPPPAPPVPKP